MWFAAELIYPGRRFDRYAVLGDDIVIADARVAKVYSEVIDRFGVKISKVKSLISRLPSSLSDFLCLVLKLSPLSVKAWGTPPYEKVCTCS